MEVSFRQAAAADALLLIELYNRAFYADFLRYGECPAYGRTEARMRQSIEKFPKEIILCGSAPVGVLSVENRGGGEYYLGCLCVIPEFQGKGIGTHAVRHLLESRPDWKCVTLITPADKKENIRFYTKNCGFRIAGTKYDGRVKVVRLIRERDKAAQPL